MIDLLINILAIIGGFAVFLALLMIRDVISAKIEDLKEEKFKESRNRIAQERDRLIEMEERGFRN